MTDIQDQAPEVEVDHGHDHHDGTWILLADARAQAAAFARAFLPKEPDEVDCETCRVIKLIAAGLEGTNDGG